VAVSKRSGVKTEIWRKLEICEVSPGRFFLEQQDIGVLKRIQN